LMEVVGNTNITKGNKSRIFFLIFLLTEALKL